MAPIRVPVRLTPSLLVLIFALVSMIAPLPVAATDEVDRVGYPCNTAAEVPPPPPDYPPDWEGERNTAAEVPPPPPDYPPDCVTSHRPSRSRECGAGVVPASIRLPKDPSS
jgi:hypothetical protein